MQKHYASYKLYQSFETLSSLSLFLESQGLIRMNVQQVVTPVIGVLMAVGFWHGIVILVTGGLPEITYMSCGLGKLVEFGNLQCKNPKSSLPCYLSWLPAIYVDALLSMLTGNARPSWVRTVERSWNWMVVTVNYVAACPYDVGSVSACLLAAWLSMVHGHARPVSANSMEHTS